MNVLVSSEYFNAIFGYNFNIDAQHPDPTHEDHPVHEFDAASVPGTLSFDKVLVAAATDAADGGEATVYLQGLVLKLHPRAEHIKRGLNHASDLVFKLDDAGHGTIKIPSRTLTVPDGSIRPGKWLISPRLFPPRARLFRCAAACYRFARQSE